MKIVAMLTLFVSAMAFANPTGTAPAATAPTKPAADHGKMGHGNTKAATATATATECKNKSTTDGKCLDEVKK